MSRSLRFTIDGPIQTLVTIEEVVGASGQIELKVTVTADESGGIQADLRGVFFDFSDESILANVTATGGDVTDQQFKANKVTDLGNGANMKGAHTKKGNGFDGGVEIGSQGIGRDDISSTEFTLALDGADLTLDALGGERMGLRYTSVGEQGNRNDSLKLAGEIPNPPDAIDDKLTTNEDNAGTINILSNDTDDDGDTLIVTGIEGGTVGTAFAVVTDGGRTGFLTVNADGTATFDPAGNFDDLRDAPDTVTLNYSISDGNGGSDMAQVAICITAVNDPPVANDDGAFYVEFGDTALVDVLANDTDVDNQLNPNTLLISGANSGTATNNGGQLQYTANSIAYDTVDSSVADAMTYTVKDGTNLISNPANVTAQVIDPLRETATDSQNAAINGQLISLSLSTEDRTYNDSSFVEAAISFGSLDQTDVNISFVLDGSGSIGGPDYTTQVDAVQQTIDDLRAQFAGTTTDVEIQLVQFSGDQNVADPAPEAVSGVFDLYDPVLDDVDTGTPLRPYLSEFTNYEAGLDEAVDFFASQAGDENIMLFVSDGQPNRAVGPGGTGINTTSPAAYTDEVAELNALGVSITAIGFGAGINTATLDLIDNTGGSQVLTDVSELQGALDASPLFPADIIDFSLVVNGIDQGLDIADLIDLGGGNFGYNGSLSGLDNDLGDVNEVIASASFDTNNDGFADEFRTSTTFINGTDGTDIIFA